MEDADWSALALAEPNQLFQPGLSSSSRLVHAVLMVMDQVLRQG